MKRQMIRNTRTRQALIDAFRILVNQKDYDEISVKEITELAEVNRNSFYNYFRNIDDLLHDIIFERIVGCYYVEEEDHWCGWEESGERLVAFFEDDDNRGFIADVFRGADGFRRAFFYDVCLYILTWPSSTASCGSAMISGFSWPAGSAPCWPTGSSSSAAFPRGPLSDICTRSSVHT